MYQDHFTKNQWQHTLYFRSRYADHSFYFTNKFELKVCFFLPFSGWESLSAFVISYNQITRSGSDFHCSVTIKRQLAKSKRTNLKANLPLVLSDLFGQRSYFFHVFYPNFYSFASPQFYSTMYKMYCILNENCIIENLVSSYTI